MTASQIFALLAQIAQFIISYGPSAFADAKKVVANLELAYASATSGTPLTAEQQTAVDTSLDEANTALQSAVASQQATVAAAKAAAAQGTGDAAGGAA